MGFMKKMKKKVKKCGAKVAAEVVENTVEKVGDVIAVVDMDEIAKLSTRAMMKLLELATKLMMDMARDAATWKLEEFCVSCPGEDKIRSAASLVGKIPLGIGKALREQIKDSIEEVRNAIVDALVAVANSGDCLRLFLEPITSLKPDDVVKLCKADGPALAKFMQEMCTEGIKNTMKPIVDTVLDGHWLTEKWDVLAKLYNEAAEKLSAVDPIETNLTEYVLDSFIEKTGQMVCGKEDKIKSEPNATEDEDIIKLWGNTDSDSA